MSVVGRQLWFDVCCLLFVVVVLVLVVAVAVAVAAVVVLVPAFYNSLTCKYNPSWKLIQHWPLPFSKPCLSDLSHLRRLVVRTKGYVWNMSKYGTPQIDGWSSLSHWSSLAQEIAVMGRIRPARHGRVPPARADSARPQHLVISKESRDLGTQLRLKLDSQLGYIGKQLNYMYINYKIIVLFAHFKLELLHL